MPTSAPIQGGLTLEQIGQKFKSENPTQDPTRANMPDWMVGAAYVKKVLAANPQNKSQIMGSLVPSTHYENLFNTLDQHIANYKAGEAAKATGDKAQQDIQANTPTLGGFAKNVVTSGGSFLKGLGNLVLHPIKSAESLGKVGLGALESGANTALGAQFNDQNTAAAKDAFQKMVMDRYGSLEKFAKTVYNDPVGFLADLSTVFGGVESVASKVGDVGKIGEAADVASGAGKAADVAGAAGRAADLTNPIKLGADAVIGAGKKITQGAGWVAKQTIGRLSGVGIDNISDFTKIIRSGTPEERTAALQMMRNNDAFRSTYDSIVSAAKQVKSIRGDNYRAALATLDKGTSYDVSPVLNKMNSMVEDFTKKPLGKDGQVNFSLSGIKQSDQADIQRAVDAVRGRLAMKGGRTLDGLDSLKQDLHNLSQGLSQKAKTFVTQLEKQTRTVLADNVKGYSAMEADYAQKSKLLDELTSEFSPSAMKQALGMGGKGKFSAGVKKIVQLAKTDDSFKRDILQQIQSESGTKDLIAKLSGAAFSPLVSEGGLGKLGESFGLWSVVQSFFNPSELVHLGSLFILTSPRVMGELLTGLGYSAKAADAFTRFMVSSTGRQFQDFIIKGGTAAERVPNDTTSQDQQMGGMSKVPQQ